MRCLPTLFVASLILANAPLANAGEESSGATPLEPIPGTVISEMQAKADNTSIIWLKRGKDYTEADVNQIARTILGEAFIDQNGGEKYFSDNVGNLHSLSALTLPVSAATARARVAEEKILEVGEISSNSLIFGMGFECGDEDDQKAISTTESLPRNIKRVNPSPVDASALTKTVWIVDSGIGPGSDIANELQIVEQRLCTGSCVSETPADPIGHGTMVAGIIGAKKGNNLELIGVAPGIRIRALRIFTASYPVDLLSNALTALQYVKTYAAAGDVVNVSFGAYYNPLYVPGAASGTTEPSPESKVEDLLRDLAQNKQLFISVAAGNTDVIGGSGYVQTISPARAGGYRFPSTGTPTGAVITVSAVRKTDVFWNFSAYGNGNIDMTSGIQIGPPDFAAPGVKIRSLWPGNVANPNGQTNVCSGTSFAAAHVSGLLVYGIPKPDKSALFDPSALVPGKLPGSDKPSDYSVARQDPIATKP
ncbi:S8 family serine peptidase [Mesorhizobium sp. M0615]|uniref:S8 family peptidase n=1 Tax=unclassified Mesorhizobium TaxID=325217 RepID=UPI0003CF3DA9|nr:MULTISPECIES: S8 family serine peptidase [unclassified Mesorhizobium]ESY10526.1 hypothetical protein X752_14870 [Mesorhizobium sp. LNJC398B00]ESY35847.1 hypothetical protein X748_15415 [Mesorhizobium sp. LNJC386A00]